MDNLIIEKNMYLENPLKKLRIEKSIVIDMKQVLTSVQVRNPWIYFSNSPEMRETNWKGEMEKERKRKKRKERKKETFLVSVERKQLL